MLVRVRVGLCNKDCRIFRVKPSHSKRTTLYRKRNTHVNKYLEISRESERDTPGERGTGVSHGALHVGVLQTHHNINVQINVQQRKSKY